MGSAAAASCSFRSLQFGHGLKRVDLVPPRKGKERFVTRGAMRQIGFQNAFDGSRRSLRGHIAE